MNRTSSLHRHVRDIQVDTPPFSAPASARSRFESLTEASRCISSHRARVLGLLVGAADPRECGGSVVLQPLWANEAMHRAWSFSRLLLRLDQGDVGEDPFSRIREQRIAEELAQAYGELRIRADVAMQPCSQILQNVVINLVGLFPPARRILLRTAIDPLVLSEFKRRALVLLGSELVMNALAHAFNEPTGGEIKVMLEVSTGGSARLVVSDDGCGMNVQAMGVCCPIASDLADLLETDLDRRPGPNGGTSVEAAFSWRG